MNYDLNEITADWECPQDEVAARILRSGKDDEELVQLRVDLGILQMFPDGRPDGKCHGGRTTALDFVRGRLKRDDAIAADDWRELRRELNQFNYRRLAFSCLAEEALHDEDAELGRLHLNRTLRDIDHCLLIMRMFDEHCPSEVGGQASLIPTLIFNRARLLARLRAVEGRYEEAIEEAEAGMKALEFALAQAGFDEEQLEQDAGVDYLQQYGQRLRAQYDIKRTLQEKLGDAIDSEDFEAAARLRDQLRRRQGAVSIDPPASPDDDMMGAL